MLAIKKVDVASDVEIKLFQYRVPNKVLQVQFLVPDQGQRPLEFSYDDVRLGKLKHLFVL